MKLYNTLTRKIENFVPLNNKHVNMFVCGPTVYDYIHIGNAKTYVQMDIIVRSLRYLGYDVTYLQNITDIDDKIIAKAQEAGEDWQALTKKYLDAYYEDTKKLGITSISTYARATGHIEDIIAQVQQLVDKGFAYTIDDGIYFEVAKFPNYGKLSGRKEVKENDAQTRIDENKNKRGWNDFCLWKFSKPDEPSWDSPYGRGRPGWHIEDTAITEHYFGPQYDIHGGAVDLIFPHHEAEITQMEAASGKSPLVKYWLHAGFLNISGSKMGKSKGNFTTLRDVYSKGYSTNAIRLFFTQAHYRSAQDFSWDNLDAAVNRLSRWEQAMDMRWQASDNDDATMTPGLDKLKLALGNDIDTPNALTIVDEIIDEIGKGHFSKPNVEAFATVLIDVFGIDLISGRDDITVQQKQILADRQSARDARDYTKSDQLRSQLEEQGIVVSDTGRGQIWSRV